MTTTLGQQAVYRLDSSRYMQAIVTNIISGDTVELVAFQDGTAWGDGDGTNVASKLYNSVDKGTGVGEWQPATVVSDAVAAGVATCEGYTDTAISGLPAPDISGACAVPGAGSAVGSPTLNSPRRPSATRPTQITVYGSVAMTSTILGPQSATVVLKADTSATPTTAVGSLPFALSGVGATATMPFTMTYDVPANHYYQVTATTSANATVTLSHINEQMQ